MERGGPTLARPSRQSHLLALLAIARKDCVLFLRYPFNAVLRVVEPLIWLTPVYYLGKSFAGAAGNAGFAAYTGTGDFLSFILVGTILSNYVAGVFWGIGFSLKDEMDAGVLESNWLAPLPPFLFLVGRTLATLAITTINNAMILSLGWLLFGFEVTGNVLPALGVGMLMLIALYGFGFAFAALVLLLREANTLIDLSNFTVILLSGAHFPVQALPRFLLPLSLALPLTYGYDAVRTLLLGTSPIAPLAVELAILLGAMAVLTPAGYVIFRLVERRCRRLGTVGLH